MGLNNKFAWGSTASYVDNKDVFHETVRDNNGTFEYLFKGKWIPFRVRK
jgi:acyl-homoserine lactone acylase PvdQ